MPHEMFFHFYRQYDILFKSPEMPPDPYCRLADFSRRVANLLTRPDNQLPSSALCRELDGIIRNFWFLAFIAYTILLTIVHNTQ